MLVLGGCRDATTTTPYFIEDDQTEPHKIDRHPPANPWRQGKLAWLPGFSLDTENPMVMDIRSADLSSLNLKDEWGALRYATFDSHTIWPAEDQMPQEFDWERLMEMV